LIQKMEENKMDLGSVLSRAWQIIWKHKVLWIFGILAGCTNGSSGLGNSFRYNYQGQLPPEIQPYYNQFANLPQWMIVLLVLLAILVALILVVLAIFLGTIGRVGLIRGVQQADQGAVRLLFNELFNGSMPYFWRVFGLNLLFGLAAALVGILVVIFVIIGAVVTLGIGLICLIPLLCLLVPIGWFVNIILEQANIAIVVENLGILDGVRRGWDVVRNNLGIVIVMGLILFIGVGLIGGFIIGLPLVAIVIPAVLGAAAGTRTTLGGGLLVAGLCFVAYLPVLIILNGILRSYVESAWTLTYLRLTGRPAVAEPAS
jgi:hypothetical protein